MVNVHSFDALLATAALAAMLGSLLRGAPPRRRSSVRRRLLELLLSAASGSAAAALGFTFSTLPPSLGSAGVLGFAAGLLWGPRGLWRLARWLRLSGTGPEPTASNASKKVLD